MSAFGKLRKAEGGRLHFWCPGCETDHMVLVKGPNAWGFNDDPESPTFTPSVLVTSGHYINGERGCWCKFYAERPDEKPGFKCIQCHSFVTNGMIQFLSDCNHSLAGQTVPLPNHPWNTEDA